MKNGLARSVGLLILSFASLNVVSIILPDASAEAGFMPPAFPAFCEAYPAGCKPAGPMVREIALNAEREREMRAVNAEVNQTIRQVADRGADVWSLPRNGKGDCEDIALLKRERLIAFGWPTSVLLMTVVRDRQGNGHAVLTVVTDRGDYILDNKTPRIRFAAATGYIYYSRQSTFSPRTWVNITFGPKKLSTASIGPENLVTDEDLLMDGLRHLASIADKVLRKAGDWYQALEAASEVQIAENPANAPTPFFSADERRRT